MDGLAEYARHTADGLLSAAVTALAAVAAPPPTEAELNLPVDIVLTETETMSLLDLPGTWIAPSAADALAAAAADRERYAAVLERARITPAQFAARAAQTTVVPRKDKDATAAAAPGVTAGTMATEADLFDTDTVRAGPGAWAWA